MNRVLLPLLMGVVVLTGCGKKSSPKVNTPLTQEEWHKISDDEVKYNHKTLERLRAGAPGKNVN